MRRLALLLPGLCGLLAACGGPAAVTSAPPPRRYAAPPPPLRRLAPGTVHFQNLPGLEGVIGATEPRLVAQFGPPRLDVIEGDARKLQFTGVPCVLDIYLYPAAPGAEPQAAYVDARRTDGRDVDRAACVAALKRR
ncbi:MAG: hypothetical protein KGK11_10840 [Sphingomonadales bacterium]|nr:hypothetical protein [Sphingomonadales bacterium]